MQTLIEVTGQPFDTGVGHLCAEGLAGMGHVPYGLKFGEGGACLKASMCFGAGVRVGRGWGLTSDSFLGVKLWLFGERGLGRNPGRCGPR